MIKKVTFTIKAAKIINGIHQEPKNVRSSANIIGDAKREIAADLINEGFEKGRYYVEIYRDATNEDPEYATEITITSSIGNEVELKLQLCLEHCGELEIVNQYGYLDDEIEEIKRLINGRDAAEYSRAKASSAKFISLGFKKIANTLNLSYKNVIVRADDVRDTFEYKNLQGEFVKFTFIDELQKLYSEDHENSLNKGDVLLIFERTNV